MEKVYLLLRNNQQTGPFTIDELLQQQLYPADMLWIEGRSTAWYHLSEMELMPSFKNASPSPSPSIPEINTPKRRSSHHDEIERKAEELRKKALSFAPQFQAGRMTQLTAVANDSRSQQVTEVENTIDFIDHRNDKKLPVPEILTGVLVTVFVAASLLGGRAIFIEKPNTPTPVAAKIISTDEHSAKVQAQQSTLIAAENIQTLIKVDSALIVKKTRPQKRQNATAAMLTDNLSIKTIESLTSASKKEEVSIEAASIDTSPAAQEDKKSEAAGNKENVQDDSKNSEAKPEEEKKKGFLKNIFRKKKKE